MPAGQALCSRGWSSWPSNTSRKGVVFLGIDSNRQDAVTEIASYARVHEIDFPILKDLNQVVADQVGATRTPEVVVLDAKHAIRYRGRIDDQYGFKSNANYQKAAPRPSAIWPTALDEVLAGKPVSKRRDASRRLLDRPRSEAGRRQRRDLHQADRADHERQLRVLPPRGPDRAVHADQLRGSRRLGRHDRRSRAVAADAALARRRSNSATSRTTPG